MRLSLKENIFCSRYVLTGDLISSLKFAGYSSKFYNSKKAISILEKSKIQKKIQDLRLEQKKNIETIVLNGLKKLAFGNVYDQVKSLIKKDFNKENNLNKNFFNVKEIRIPRDDAIEIKFFNRQKAMEKLLDITKQNEENNQFSSNLTEIFNALKNS